MIEVHMKSVESRHNRLVQFTIELCETDRSNKSNYTIKYTYGDGSTTTLYHQLNWTLHLHKMLDPD